MHTLVNLSVELLSEEGWAKIAQVDIEYIESRYKCRSLGRFILLSVQYKLKYNRVGTAAVKWQPFTFHATINRLNQSRLYILAFVQLMKTTLKEMAIRSRLRGVPITYLWICIHPLVFSSLALQGEDQSTQINIIITIITLTNTVLKDSWSNRVCYLLNKCQIIQIICIRGVIL